MTTIRDVAALAGVSVGTVSRVLSKNKTVKYPLKERVLSAVKELGYTPNFAARALRSKEIDIICLVVPDITNPFFARLVNAIEMLAAEREHFVMLANSHDDSILERNLILAFLDRKPKGMIVVAASNSQKTNYDTNVRIISLDRKLHDFPLISTDHEDGSAKIANHLFELGHRKITYIAGPQNTQVGRTRKKGFLSQIKKLNQKDDPIDLQVFQGNFNYESGEELGYKILNPENTWQPTAIAAASDQLAIGLLRAARNLGMEVPRDLSVAGFDDIELASLIIPRLTTIKQPIELLAKAAVDYLFSENKKIPQTDFEGKLLARSSTAPLNQIKTIRSPL